MIKLISEWTPTHNNDCQYNGIFPSIAIALNYNKINDLIREWSIQFQESTNKEITQEEYFEWKLNWPFKCDDGGQFEPPIHWRKA